jgi:hypothetical protein
VNQSGYDLVVSGRRKALVSVKALAQVEGFGWPQGSSEKSLGFDVVLHINFGCMLTPKGRYAKFGISVKGGPEVYLVPRQTVVTWIGDAVYGMGKVTLDLLLEPDAEPQRLCRSSAGTTRMERSLRSSGRSHWPTSGNIGRRKSMTLYLPAISGVTIYLGNIATLVRLNLGNALLKTMA